MRSSCPCLAADLLEPPAHFSQAHAIEADPCEDQTNNVRLHLHRRIGLLNIDFFNRPPI